MATVDGAASVCFSVRYEPFGPWEHFPGAIFGQPACTRDEGEDTDRPLCCFLTYKYTLYTAFTKGAFDTRPPPSG